MSEFYDKSNYLNSINAIKQGATTVYPTETVYGIGAVIDNEISLKRIFDIKKRPLNKPLSLNIADVKMAKPYLSDDDFKIYQKIADKYLPGPLSVIFKTSFKSSAAHYFTQNCTISLRMPDNEMFQDVLRRVGPIAGTSANLSGHLSLTTPKDIKESLDESSDIILLDGDAKIGIESTIIDLTGHPVIRRIGAISSEELSVFLDDSVKNIQEQRRYYLNKHLYIYKNKEELTSLIQKFENESYMIWGDNFGLKGKNKKNSINYLNRMFQTLKEFDRDEDISIVFAQQIDDDLYTEKLKQVASEWH